MLALTVGSEPEDLLLQAVQPDNPALQAVNSLLGAGRRLSQVRILNSIEVATNYCEQLLRSADLKRRSQICE